MKRSREVLIEMQWSDFTNLAVKIADSDQTELPLATLAEALADVSAGRVEYFEDFDSYLAVVRKL